MPVDFETAVPSVRRWVDELRPASLGPPDSVLPDAVRAWAVSHAGGSAVAWALDRARTAADLVSAITSDIESADAAERRFLSELICVTSLVGLYSGIAEPMTMLRTAELSWPRGIYFASFSGLLRITAHTNAYLSDAYLEEWIEAHPDGADLDDTRVISGVLYACGLAIAERALSRSIGDLGLPDETTARTRLALIEDLLSTGEQPDGFAAEFAYGVRDGAHVAVIARLAFDSTLAQQQALARLALDIHAADFCFVNADPRTAWIWFRVPPGAKPPKVAGRDLPHGIVWAAWGTVGDGVAGFVDSHHQASRVAGALRSEALTIGASARFEDLEHWLAHLADPDATCAMIVRTLGMLADDDVRIDPLRDTLQSMLRTGSATATARDQFLTRNAVLYRVKKAESLLPEGAMSRPLELAIALTVRRLIDPLRIRAQLRGWREAEHGSPGAPDAPSAMPR